MAPQLSKSRPAAPVVARPPSPSATGSSGATPLIALRPYQSEAFWDDAGLILWLWRRQAGKSHLLGAWGIMQMMRMVCDVIYCSASLRLGVENIRKEATIWMAATAAYRKAVEQSGKMMQTTADGLDLDAVCDLFEHQRLETRIYHDRTSVSRSVVVAPNPDTAVGWTGHIVFDEVGRMPEFRDMLEAVEPFMSSNPQFLMRWATTPAPDDAHYSWELTVTEEEFTPNPRGNWYTSSAGILVHRLDAWDADAAGVPMYHPKTRKPVTPEEARALAFDKAAWDRNYALKFVRGGSAAIGLAALNHAMLLGRGEGVAENITEDIVL